MSNSIIKGYGILVFWSLALFAFAQQPAYYPLTEEDGLPGKTVLSMVYCIKRKKGKYG